MAGRVGDLRQRQVGDGDVVGGGVGSGVARAQHPGQGLSGVVAEHQQRVIAEAALERRGCLLLLAVAGHQGGVDVEHQPDPLASSGGHHRQRPAQLAGCQPRPLPRRRAGRPQQAQQRLIHGGQDPPRRRGGGHSPEQLRLLAQHREIGDGLAAVGEHHRHIGQHPPRVMRRAALPQPRQDLGVALGQPRGISKIREQPGPRVGGDTPPIGRDHQARACRCSVHLRSASLGRRTWTFDKPMIPARTGTPCVPGPRRARQPQPLLQRQG